MVLLDKIKAIFQHIRKIICNILLAFRSKIAGDKVTLGPTFKEIGLNNEITTLLESNKFTNATEVQKQAIPIALQGKNVFCSSETGSGKTLAFLLPMIQKFHNKEIHQALIICPTREIAIQIDKELKQFKDEKIVSALVIGGTSIAKQKEELRKYPKILVATPGRLLDMLSTGYIWLNHSDYVVLDEADRMLDMGFEDDLMAIHSHLSGAHQTLMFSATMLSNVKVLAERYATDYQEIVIGEPTRVASSIEHVLVEINERDKLPALKHLLRHHTGKVIVFFNSINTTTRVTSQLKRHNSNHIDCIHSKIEQKFRERIIKDFHSGEIQVLLASDIASRGIDIPSVSLVINFDIPHVSEEYIHRVGRTGRGGKGGMAISFSSTYKDKKNVNEIEALLGSAIKVVKSYKGLSDSVHSCK